MALGSNDDFGKHICTLIHDISSLKSLRPQSQAIPAQAGNVSKDDVTGFITIPTIHKAFKTLGYTLVSAWSCNDHQHQEHAMCLDLDVDITASDVYSNLVLSYQDPLSNGSNAGSDSAKHYLMLKTRNANKAQRTDILTFRKGDATMCEYLAECVCTANPLRGRLSTVPNGPQTDLYHDDVRCSSSKVQVPVAKEFRLHEILDWFRYLPDKYQLAHKLATATLHLNGTPWLPSTWRLNMITALRRESLCETIGTMFVTMPLSVVTGPVAAEPPQDPEVYFSAGVPNATLFYLGVALLEIEHGFSLETFKSSKQLESKSDFDVARRMSVGPTTDAGMRYRTLAKKCLTCNFGSDKDDLECEVLQEAVYGGLVSKLGQLVAECKPSDVR